jgi:hypothetical protein
MSKDQISHQLGHGVLLEDFIYVEKIKTFDIEHN